MLKVPKGMLIILEPPAEMEKAMVELLKMFNAANAGEDGERVRARKAMLVDGIPGGARIGFLLEEGVPDGVPDSGGGMAQVEEPGGEGEAGRGEGEPEVGPKLVLPGDRLPPY